jgi:hypothetical protein
MALDSALDVDERHPIPRVDAYDALLTTDQGAYLGLVIASPLRDDEVSRIRLQRKLEMYMTYFQSPEYRDRCGAPSPTHCKIYVSIHSKSLPRSDAVKRHMSHFEAHRRQLTQMPANPSLERP